MRGGTPRDANATIAGVLNCGSRSARCAGELDAASGGQTKLALGDYGVAGIQSFLNDDVLIDSKSRDNRT